MLTDCLHPVVGQLYAWEQLTEAFLNAILLYVIKLTYCSIKKPMYCLSCIDINVVILMPCLQVAVEHVAESSSSPGVVCRQSKWTCKPVIMHLQLWFAPWPFCTDVVDKVGWECLISAVTNEDITRRYIWLTFDFFGWFLVTFFLLRSSLAMCTDLLNSLIC